MKFIFCSFSKNAAVRSKSKEWLESELCVKSRTTCLPTWLESELCVKSRTTCLLIWLESELCVRVCRTTCLPTWLESELCVRVEQHVYPCGWNQNYVSE